jgi:hypothetical protein
MLAMLPVLALEWSAAITSIECSRSDDTTFVIPFAYDPPSRPLITIRGRLGSSEPMVFIVDSGSQAGVVLQPWAAKQAGIQTAGEPIFAKPGNVRLQPTRPFTGELLTRSADEPLSINVTTAYVGEVGFVSEYPGLRVAGIIGGDLFKAVAATFDFGARTMTIRAPGADAITPAPKALVLPITYGPDGILPHVKVSMPGGLEVPLTVDTGRNATGVPADKLAGLKSIAKGRTTVDTLEGQKKTETVLLETLRIAGLDVPLVEVGTSPDGLPGLLGLDVLSRFKCTLDGPNKRLILEPRASTTSLHGGFVLELRGDNGSFTVSKVLEPKIAGSLLQAGDQLVSIDGKPVDLMGFVEASLRLHGFAGIPAVVETERAGTKHKHTWIRPSPYANVLALPQGVTVLWGEDGPARVIYVTPDSPAAKAGITISDTVTALNDRPTADWKTSDHHRILGGNGQGGLSLQSVTVTQRNGGKKVRLAGTP